jgi:hypothetical protein
MVKKRLTAFLLAAVIITLPLTMACNGAKTLANLQAVVSGAKDVLAGMSAVDPNFAKVQKFVDDAQALLTAYQNAASTTGCVDLASIAADVVGAFQSVILPLLVVNPIIAAAIAGIDVALRLVIANFHTCVAAALSARTAGTLGAAGVDKLGDADAVFRKYLASPKIKK